MAMCIQNEIVRDGFVQHCPRMIERGYEGLLDVKSCVKKCRFCRGYLFSVSHLGEYTKGSGWDGLEKEVVVVVCDYQHVLEAGKRGSEAVTCNAEK